MRFRRRIGESIHESGDDFGDESVDDCIDESVEDFVDESVDDCTDESVDGFVDESVDDFADLPDIHRPFFLSYATVGPESEKEKSRDLRHLTRSLVADAARKKRKKLGCGFSGPTVCQRTEKIKRFLLVEHTKG